jgi:hypothetical protein
MEIDLNPAPSKRRAVDVYGVPLPLDDNTGEQPVFGGGGGNDSESDDEDIFRGPQYSQVGLPTREAETNAFKDPPQSRSKCFGCIYFGENKSGQLPKRKIDRMMKKLIESIGQMDPIALYKETALEYESIRREVNNRLQPGERRLPEWKEATIAEHFRSHHADPQFHLWAMQNQMREINDIAMQASIRKDKEGNLSIDKEQHKCYLDGTKALIQLMKVKAQDCMFYNEGKALNVKAMSSGPVAFQLKPIVDMLQRGNKR